MNDTEIGPDGTANIIINNTSSNIETMDPKQGSTSQKFRMLKKLKEQQTKEVVIKQLQKVGVLPSGKEIKSKVAKKEGDTLKRIADAGQDKTIQKAPKKKTGDVQYKMP